MNRFGRMAPLVKIELSWISLISYIIYLLVSTFLYQYAISLYDKKYIMMLAGSIFSGSTGRAIFNDINTSCFAIWPYVNLKFNRKIERQSGMPE
jgi:hypothetical protein